MHDAIPTISQQIKVDGYLVSITPHAFERALQRVFGDTTRDVTAEFCELLELEASVRGQRPDWKAEAGADVTAAADAWLTFDCSGLVFAMPLVLTNGVLYAKTLVVPGYKACGGRASAKPRRKGRSGNRHKRMANRRAHHDEDFDSHEYMAGEYGEYDGDW